MIDEVFWNMFWAAIVIGMFCAQGRWKKVKPESDKEAEKDAGALAFLLAYATHAFLLFSLAWNITQVAIFIAGSSE